LIILRAAIRRSPAKDNPTDIDSYLAKKGLATLGSWLFSDLGDAEHMLSTHPRHRIASTRRPLSTRPGHSHQTMKSTAVALKRNLGGTGRNAGPRPEADVTRRRVPSGELHD